jgi:membrane protein implicated in regulation of membrane protease activity
MDAVSEWLQQLQYWHWWVAALVLLILEVLSPGIFFMWMGVAAGLVGLLLLLLPGLSWTLQLALFGLFSLIAVRLGWSWVRSHSKPSDVPLLNRRAEQYMQRIFILENATENGIAQVRVDDSRWKVRVSGAALDAGARVRIVGVEGSILEAVPAEEGGAAD